MKKLSTFTKITNICLTFNLLLILSGFCFGMFVPAATAAPLPETDVMTGCDQASMPRAMQSLSADRATNNTVLPCCLEQSHEATSTVTPQKIEPFKKIISSLITPLPLLTDHNQPFAHTLHYHSPPPNDIRLETIVLRV